MQDLNKEKFVDVVDTTWVPNWLLCKQWGMLNPSTVSMSAVAGKGLAGRGQGGQGKEEDYFRKTVYNPAVADNTTKTTTNGGKGAMSTSERGAAMGVLVDEAETAHPLQKRPFAEVFDPCLMLSPTWIYPLLRTTSIHLRWKARMRAILSIQLSMEDTNG